MNILDQYGRRIKKKTTFGSDCVDNAIKQLDKPDNYEIGEVLNEVWKNISNEMADGIAKTRKKGFKGPIYIQIQERKLPANFGTNGDRF